METRFIADVNVGTLAKWLRIMGYDTLFFRDIDDGELVDIALAENRVLLTRDTHIMERRVMASGEVRAVLIRDDALKKQLAQVMDETGIDGQQRFLRCIECNEPLADRDKSDVADLVPPYVYATQQQYMQCVSCGKVYWRGTHWERMDRELRSLVEGD
jgi:uncharacterized protein with PIN domain